MTDSISNLIAGCGYLGRRVAESWLADGEAVSAITRSESKAAELQSAGVRPVIADLSSDAAELALPAADVVLWSVGFDRNVDTPRHEIWLGGLHRLVAGLSSAPSRIIYVSSTSIYGRGTGENVDESTPANPATDGGKFCLYGELILRSLCATRFPAARVTALRLAGIYGPDRLLRRVDDLRNNIPMPGEPDQPLNLIHVDDAVRMVKHIGRADDVPDVINVVSKFTVTRREYYSRLAELADAPPPEFEAKRLTRGGNKRVLTLYDELRRDFQFNDVLEGLEDAVSRSNI